MFSINLANEGKNPMDRKCVKDSLYIPMSHHDPDFRVRKVVDDYTDKLRTQGANLKISLAFSEYDGTFFSFCREAVLKGRGFSQKHLEINDDLFSGKIDLQIIANNSNSQ